LGQASAKLNFVVPFTGSSVVLRRPLMTPVETCERTRDSCKTYCAHCKET